MRGPIDSTTMVKEILVMAGFLGALCLAFPAVILLNAVVIWLVTGLIEGIRRSYYLAAFTSLLEIAVIFLLDWLVLGIIYFVNPPQSQWQEAYGMIFLEPLNALPLLIIQQALALVFTFAVLTLLIRAIYKFRTKMALKAAAIVVVVDVLLTLSFAVLFLAADVFVF